jgi:hypothetical protein
MHSDIEPDPILGKTLSMELVLHLCHSKNLRPKVSVNSGDHGSMTMLTIQ